MKTEQLELVLSIARERSISRAAASMFISQPTASNMLGSLEKELGYTLFTRTRNGIIPTNEGNEFIEYAIAIEKWLKAISQISKPLKRIDFRIASLKFDFCEKAFEELCEKYIANENAVDLALQIVNNSEDALKMVEGGIVDMAVVLGRKKTYESDIRNATKKHFETALIGEFPLELTCSRSHPIIQDGKIVYELLGKYPCFCSISASQMESYIPYFLMKYDVEIQSRIEIEPGEARYRLMQKINGYLISVPLPEEIRAAYDFRSVRIKDSDMTVFAIYCRNLLKEELINEYIDRVRLLI
ncbi:MAG: LysR family transcriptional regulator [Lachnospiraceae bacterium]|nr:LysR family transcriptional regulator [Lachnospiraceae bacterium]